MRSGAPPSEHAATPCRNPRHPGHELQGLRSALNALGDVTSAEAALDAAPAAACRLGFDRAMVSRVEDGAWWPRHFTDVKDPRWAAAILAAGKRAPIPLGAGTPETDVVRARTAVVVDDVRGRESTGRRLAAASRSRSYVIAPVVLAADVVALVHSDLYYQRRPIDDIDRQLLMLFAEGLGRTLGHAVLLDRIESARTAAAALAATLADPPSALRHLVPDRSTDDVGEAGTVRSATHTGTVPSPSPAGAAPLTRRETEVLHGLAAGHTNRQIARQFCVSEGTVKSHVRQILRKLGVANRAQAVSVYWQRPGPRE